MIAFALQCGLQLRGFIEVIFDDDDVLDPRGHRFLDDILNRRLIGQRQHLLWHGLRGWEHTSAKAGGRNDGFTDAHDGTLPMGLWWSTCDMPHEAGGASCRLRADTDLLAKMRCRTRRSGHCLTQRKRLARRSARTRVTAPLGCDVLCSAPTIPTLCASFNAR